MFWAVMTGGEQGRWLALRRCPRGGRRRTSPRGSRGGQRPLSASTGSHRFGFGKRRSLCVLPSVLTLLCTIPRKTIAQFGSEIVCYIYLEIRVLLKTKRDVWLVILLPARILSGNAAASAQRETGPEARPSPTSPRPHAPSNARAVHGEPQLITWSV